MRQKVRQPPVSRPHDVTKWIAGTSGLASCSPAQQVDSPPKFCDKHSADFSLVWSVLASFPNEKALHDWASPSSLTLHLIALGLFLTLLQPHWLFHEHTVLILPQGLCTCCFLGLITLYDWTPLIIQAPPDHSVSMNISSPFPSLSIPLACFIFFTVYVTLWNGPIYPCFCSFISLLALFFSGIQVRVCLARSLTNCQCVEQCLAHMKSSIPVYWINGDYF